MHQSLPVPPPDWETRAAQLLFPRLGSNLSPVVTAEDDAERIAAILRQVPIGGLCLFNGRWPATRDTLAQLQQSAPLSLLIGADMERGAGQQVHGLTWFPHARVFDAIGSDRVEWISQFARVTAHEARRAGIHVNFAPVADVNTDPRNPIIATRSFGTDPIRVAECVGAFVRASQAAGLLCTAKHFPGHGHTSEDSHATLPVVVDRRDALIRRDLPPFRAAIEAGVALIMSAHVSYPHWDPTGQPATTSAAVMVDLLRQELDFKGLAVSDSLLMSGVRDRYAGETELAVAALNAGIDVLLDVGDPVGTWRGLLDAVRGGRLARDRIDNAFQRLWTAKSLAWQEGTFEAAPTETASEELSQTIAERACCAWGRWTPWQRPLIACRDVGVLMVNPFEPAWAPAELPLVTALREAGCRVVEGQLFATWDETDANLERLCDCDQLIVGLLVKPAAWQRLGITADQRRIVRDLIQVDTQRVTLVALGDPSAFDDLPEVPRRLCAHSDVPASQRAAARFLLRDNDPRP